MIVSQNATEPRWEFARKLPNAVQIEPISDEFFAGLSAPADKLVRETIQNSLDARAGTGPVRVRYTIPADPPLLTAESPWLTGLAPHLTADRNGLSQPYNAGERLDTLLIEDYGTFGLTGNPVQTDNVAEEWSGQKNNFFYFWRAIGATGKGEGEKGSWGLGKSVLPASSRIHTFLGASCEEEGGEARLLGLSVLKTHTVGGRKDTLTPYGYFGLYESTDSVAMPVVDAATVATFCRDFGVRREGEPGLSLVVLYPNLAFTGPALTASVVANYFFPILEGQLVVEVAAGENVTVIDAASVRDCALQIPPHILEAHGIEPATLFDLLELARWSVAQRRVAAIRLHPPPEATRPRWKDAMFAVDGWDGAVAQFAAGEAVEFIVPVSVAHKSGLVEEAEFFVSLKKIPPGQKPRSFYLRDGITVGKPSDRGERGLVAFAAVEAGPLARFLRRSEDPSHTEWRAKGTRLGEHYERPQLLLSFVKDSIAEVHERLTRVKEGIDADLLADLFFLEETDSDAPAKPDGSGRGVRPQKARVPANLQTELQPVRVGKRGDDILLVGVPGIAVAGQTIRVRLAYDVRRGNPFAKWSKFDFDFSGLQNRMEWDGAMRLKAEGNVLKLAVERPDFKVIIAGLDPARDVRVETRVESESAANQ
jgi:hypothetical protein